MSVILKTRDNRVTKFSSDTFPEVPPAVNEFVQNLSGGRFINDVYTFSSADDVAEFIMSSESGFQNVKQKQAEAIAIITKPYLEKDGKVNIGIIDETMYAYDSNGIAISFVKPSQVAEKISEGSPLIGIDGVHAGTSIPQPVIDLINPNIITNKPIYNAGAYTALRQSDVGVKEIIGKLWQGNKQQNNADPVIGTAFLWNLIICNGNRPMPSEEETTPEYLESKRIDCWLTTETYRGDSIYNDNQLPSQEIRDQIQEGHSFGIKVAGAARSSLYFFNQNKPIIIEPHTYSGFYHPFLSEHLNQNQRHYTGNLIKLASQEDCLRPLVSVLDVQKESIEGEEYWTTTLEESQAFYLAFLEQLRKNEDKLLPFDNIPESLNDVYGYGGGILKRLEQVVEQAAQYVGVEYNVMKDFYQHNIFTVEINRLLVQLPEFEDVSNVCEQTYHQRCQIVGEALSAGFQRVVPLIVERLKEGKSLKAFSRRY